MPSKKMSDDFLKIDDRSKNGQSRISMDIRLCLYYNAMP